MKWQKLRMYVFLAIVIIILVGAKGCCPKDTSEVADKTLQNGSIQKNLNLNINTAEQPKNINGFINHPTEVIDIELAQIHLTDEETPHKYKLTAIAFDPDPEDLLHYRWETDCGYFPFQEERPEGTLEPFEGYTTDNTVEWWYDVPGDCLGAEITVLVKDFYEIEESFAKNIFEEE